MRGTTLIHGIKSHALKPLNAGKRCNMINDFNHSL